MRKLQVQRLRATALFVLLVTALVPAIQAGTHSVDVSASGFDPQNLTIDVGDIVVWTNTGGTHNVLADDAGFTSGPASSDLWSFSRTFYQGAVVSYHCEEHPLAETGTVTVTGIFGDPFEAGDLNAWDSSLPPSLNCNCYFSGDCAGATFCDWGVLTSEDTCLWRENKPDGVPGAGCDVEYNGPWIGGICDGACAVSSEGSMLGIEQQSLIEEGTRLWAEALLRPAAEVGGGPIDPFFAKAALSLGFKSPDAGMSLGRQVADLLATAGVPEFSDHFCHFEGHPGDPQPDLWVDLSDDPCRLSAAWTAVDALLAELDEPGTCSEIVAGIQDVCPDWRDMFGPRCTGDDALTCLEQRIADLAVFLVTERVYEESIQRLFGNPLLRILER